MSMRRPPPPKPVFRIVLGIALLALAAGALYWPRVNEAEGSRSYRSSEAAAAKAVKETIAALPGWDLVGAGSGREGAAVQAVTHTRPVGLRHEVSVTVRTAGGRTSVRVKSRSPALPWDFGRNAERVKDLLDALDARVR
jgi:hypothetical protein